MYLHLIPPKNTRKLFITLCFQGVLNGNNCQKCVDQEVMIPGNLNWWKANIAGKMCTFEVFLVSIAPYSFQMRENTDQKNFE